MVSLIFILAETHVPIRTKKNIYISAVLHFTGTNTNLNENKIYRSNVLYLAILYKHLILTLQSHTAQNYSEVS